MGSVCISFSFRRTLTCSVTDAHTLVVLWSLVFHLHLRLHLHHHHHLHHLPPPPSLQEAPPLEVATHKLRVSVGTTLPPPPPLEEAPPPPLEEAPPPPLEEAPPPPHLEEAPPPPHLEEAPPPPPLEEAPLRTQPEDVRKTVSALLTNMFGK